MFFFAIRIYYCFLLFFLLLLVFLVSYSLLSTFSTSFYSILSLHILFFRILLQFNCFSYVNLKGYLSIIDNGITEADVKIWIIEYVWSYLEEVIQFSIWKLQNKLRLNWAKLSSSLDLTLL